MQQTFFCYSVSGSHHQILVQDPKMAKVLIDKFKYGPYFEGKDLKCFLLTYKESDGDTTVINFGSLPLGRHKTQAWLEFEKVLTVETLVISIQEELR